MTKQDNTYSRLLLQLRNYTSANGKRCTSERETILGYCCEQKVPITVASLLPLAHKDRISTQTIYDTLELLVDAGILQRLVVNKQHVASYGLVSERRNRLRIICTNCGRVSRFKDLTLKDYFQTRSFDNFEMKNYTIYVYGRCKVCRHIVD